MCKRFFRNEVQSGLSQARLQPIGFGALEAKVKEADLPHAQKCLTINGSLLEK